MSDPSQKRAIGAGANPLRFSLLYGIIATLWILFSGMLLDFAVVDHAVLARWEMAKGLAFVAVTTTLLYLLLRHRTPEPIPESGLESSSIGYGVFALIVALLLSTPLMGYGVLRLYSPLLERQIHGDLAAVAGLKTAQFELWRRERLASLSAIADNRTFISQLAVQRSGQQGEGQETNAPEAVPEHWAQEQLESALKAYSSTAVLLLGSDGTPLLAAGEKAEPSPGSLSLLPRVAATGVPQISEIFLDAQGRARMDFIAPLTVAGQAQPAVTGFLLLRTAPRDFLLPVVGNWPGEKSGSETLLAHGNGDAVILLTLSEQGEFAPQPLSLPLDTPGLVAATALKGGPGTMAGIDYRGAAVFAAWQPLADSGWVLITKLDRDQALAPLRNLVTWISLVVLAALVAFSLMLLLLWRQQQSNYRLTLAYQAAEHDNHLHQQDAIYREMFEANPHPMWVFDRQSLVFLAVNDAAVSHYGYSREQFLAMTIGDIRPPGDIERLQQHIAVAPQQGMDYAGIWRHRKRDGTLIDVEVSSHPLDYNGRDAELVLAYDMTERLAMEQRLVESDHFTRSTLDTLTLNIAVLDEEGTIVATNHSWREFSRTQGGALTTTASGANYLEVCRSSAQQGDRDAALVVARLEEILAGKSEHFSHEYPCHSPTEQRWFVVHVTRFPRNGQLRIVVAHENVSDRKKAELELHKLNRYYAALSHMNSTIIRTREPQEILDAVCHIAVEFGELELVWVGHLENGTDIVPMARDGGACGFLDGFSFSTDPERPEGRTPCGTAVRQGVTIVVDNYDSDSRTAPCHGAAKSWNIRSALICPIIRRGGIWGEIAFYANQPSYFSADLVHLLEELTADLAFSLDILEIEQSRAEAQKQLLLNARVMESSHEGIFITDSENRITMVNRAICEITGYSDQELMGSNPRMLKSGQQDEEFYQHMWTQLLDTGRWEGELWDQRKNGEVFPAGLAITRVEDKDSGSVQHIAIYRDNTERKAYESRIEHLASHDHLTDLPNRTLLDDRIAMAIALAERQNRPLALLFIDLDRFKLINDTLGHPVGDLLLQEMASRICAVLRSSDTVSRVGGDEFVVLLSDMVSPEYAALVAEKIIREVSRPCQLEGHQMVVTASIGIAIYPDNGRDAAELTKLADIAMMAAKRGGQNRYHFYSGEMGEDAIEYLELLNDLRGAVSREEIFIAYQPQCDLQNQGRVIGMEALARWRHPRHGLVPPGRFIPIAEDSGLIIEIGTWILAQACRQANHWRQQGIVDVPVSVNVSALQFRQPDFVATVAKVLEGTGLPASRLELEVTESLLMTGTDQALEKLNALHRIGVGLAIDDFGTGYSSLSYLRQFPAQRLKIDKSFINDLPHDPDATAIARAIVSLGSTLGMKVIAEGVETGDQAEFLNSIWCNEGQGYLYSKPLAANDFEAWLAARRTQATNITDS